MKETPMRINILRFDIAGTCLSTIFRFPSCCKSVFEALVKNLSTPFFIIFRVGFFLSLLFTFWAVDGRAQAQGNSQEFRYRYVSLDQIAMPPGFTLFFPAAIQQNGRVYGTLCDDTCSVTQLGYFKDGQLTLIPNLPPGSFGGPVNARGTIGGTVLLDPVNFFTRAALFGEGKVTLVPPQPGEVSSSIISLSDNNTALVVSFNALFEPTYVLYRNGTATPINFGPNITNPFFSFFGVCNCINNNGIIEGIEGPGLFNGARAFRFDPRSGAATILDPFPGDPTETIAWGQAINQNGDVLGYSLVTSPPYHERIGIWGGQNGVFYTYLVETVSSNSLLFNESKLIVITQVFSNKTSYIVPRPGVRLNLADLVGNLPAGQDLYWITDLNNRGDMIGLSSTGANFVLYRLDDGDPQIYGTPAVSNQRHPIPPRVAATRDRLGPHLMQLK